MFLSVIFLIMFIFLSVFSLTLRKFERAVLLLFNIMWCFGGLLANSGLLGIYRLTIETNTIVIITIIVFNLLYISTNKIKNKRKQNNISLILEGSVNKKVFLISNIVIYIFVLPYFIKAVGIIQNSGFSYMRSLAYEQSSVYIASTFELLILQWIIQPFFLATEIIFATQIFNIKSNKSILIFAFLNLMFEIVLFGGGRRTIFSTLIFIVYSVLYHRFNFKDVSLVNNSYGNENKEKNRKFKSNIRIGIIVSLFLFIFYSITKSRLTSTTVFNSFYRYFTGPFALLDVYIKENNFYLNNSGLFYGQVTLGFILNIFLIMGTLLFNIEYNAPSSIINAVVDSYRFIAPNIMHNAHVTMLYFFICDFGYWGSIMGVILYAIMIGKIISNSRKNVRYFSISLYFINTIFMSTQTYALSGVAATTCVFFIYLLTKKGDSKQLESKIKHSRFDVKV